MRLLLVLPLLARAVGAENCWRSVLEDQGKTIRLQEDDSPGSMTACLKDNSNPCMLKCAQRYALAERVDHERNPLSLILTPTGGHGGIDDCSCDAFEFPLDGCTASGTYLDKSGTAILSNDKKTVDVKILGGTCSGTYEVQDHESCYAPRDMPTGPPFPSVAVSCTVPVFTSLSDECRDDLCWCYKRAKYADDVCPVNVWAVVGAVVVLVLLCACCICGCWRTGKCCFKNNTLGQSLLQ